MKRFWIGFGIMLLAVLTMLIAPVPKWAVLALIGVGGAVRLSAFVTAYRQGRALDRAFKSLMRSRLPVLIILAAMLSGGGVLAGEPVSPHGLSFSLDPSRTAPGSLEMELGGGVSGSDITIPAIIKYTSLSQHPLLRDLEFALIGGFQSTENDEKHRSWKMADATTLQLRRPVYDRETVRLGLAPRVTIADGERPVFGLGLLGSFTKGPHGLTVNVNGSRGTDWAEEILADYAYSIGSSGVSLFAGFAYQPISGVKESLSLGEGVSYRVRPDLQIDVALRQQGVDGSGSNAILVSVAKNFGCF